ncbi:MAG: ABC transporter ATP-binding protein [Candidatus Cloacimonetes bacterium]|nr:ABC transporter ATP-binding protein [Candidatus Cloacimonadota bacterium]
MKKIKLLWKFLKGSRTLYVLAIVAIALATIFSLLIPLITRFTIDSVIGNKPIELPTFIENAIAFVGGKNSLANNIWICGAVLVLLTGISGLFLYLKGKWAARASESIAQNLREKLYKHLQLLPFKYHSTVKTGDVIQRCTSDVNTVRRFLAIQFVQVGRAVFMVVLTLYFMLQMNVTLTIISMATIPFIFAFAVVFFLKVKKAFKQSDEAEARLSKVLQENLTGVRVVKAFARQKYEVGKFESKNKDYRDLTYRLIRLLAWYWAVSDFVSLIQIGGVLVIGSYWAATGKITLGTLLAFSAYVGQLLWPVRQMGRVLTDMGKALVSAERINEILEEPAEELSEDGIVPDFNSDIIFENVGFSYEDGPKVLEDVSFQVKKGQTVAILGPTGSGKTSLVQLLPRLYDYQKGSIKIDGVDIKQIDKKVLRENIGIVLQEPFLFSKTLRDNIKIAKSELPEHEIFSAAESANIHNVIEEFDKGYDTMVGERGATLSGGQKQRIAIARTLIRNNPILIFDDSLSAVDTKTDAAIRRELRAHSKDATTFIISHRLTTLAEADLILVLEQGRLVQKGTHQQLLSQQGLYKRVWSIQNNLKTEIDEKKTSVEFTNKEKI